MANASDPTPLVELFIEWPLLFIASIFCFFAFMKFKNSLIANIVLFFFHVLVLWWLIDVGYIKNNGDIIWLSLAINILGLGLGIYKVSYKNGNNKNT
jgi:ABC-type uncharacterized transport system permease subunit